MKKRNYWYLTANVPISKLKTENLILFIYLFISTRWTLFYMDVCTVQFVFTLDLKTCLIKNIDMLSAAAVFKYVYGLQLIISI